MSRAFMRKRNTFRPTDIGGCQLWLDGADVSTITGSSPVTAWRDKSVNNLTVTATGSPTRTTVNGLNSLSFNGSSYFSLNPFTRTNGVSYVAWFAVANITNAASAVYGTIVGTSFTANYYAQNQMYINSGSLMIWYRITFGAGASSTTVTLNPGNVLLGTATNFTTGTYQVFQNGVEGTLQTNGPTGINDSSTVSLQIGKDGPGESFIEGTISELLLYTTVLTTQQRQQVEAYLSQKWGLRQQIPQSHPGTTGIVYSQQSIPKALSLPYPVIFTPSVAGTLSMWLDGADPAGTGIPPSNGATVSTWVDKSGSGINLTAVGTPTYTLSNSSVYLDGSAYLQNTNFNFTNYTLFIVSVQTSDIGPLYTNNTTTAGYSGFFPIYYSSYYLVQSDGSWLTSTSAFSKGTTYIYSIQYDSLNNINVWSTGSISPVITGTAGTITRNKFLLGKRNVGQFSENMTGNIFEIIQYNSDLGQTARQQVEGYLAWKWGLQANLPANHPYKSSTPDVTNARGTRRPVGLPPRSNIAFPRLKIIASIDTPSATLSSLTSTGATVTWSEISGAISYTVTIYYNSSASVTTSNLQVAQSPYTLATSGSTFTFTATDTTYYAATVTAINATAQATSSISSPVLYTAPPGQATTNTPTNTGTTLNMSWSAASGSVTAYTVYILAGGSLAPSGTLSLGNVTSTTFSPMVSGTVYSFYVVATGPGGSGTQSTTSSTVTYTAVPVAPTSITLASLTATGATVTWSGGSGANYFTCQIYSSASSNMSSPSIISPQTPDSSTSITTPQVFTFSVTAGLYYGAIITAVNAGGSTSSVMSTGVLYSVAEPPVAPTTVTLASLTGSGATVTWSGGSGATYYTCQIYSSAASNMSSPTTISQSPSSSSSVSSGQVFSFSVEDSLYYGAIVTTVNASGSAASSMSTGLQFVGTYSGLGPVTTLATGFGNLYNLAIDSAENIYLADYGGNKIWYIPSGGSPSIFAGSTSGLVNGDVGSAKFNGPSGVAVSSDGATVYVTDYGNSKIRKITGGTVTTLAGGTHGAWVDGASNVARFYYPSGIAIDRTETVLFIGDKLTHRIRVVTIATGDVTTLAGGLNSTVGASGSFADGTGSNASFNSPLGVCVGLDNSVYVADSANHRIRKVTYPEGVVTTVAGSGVGGFSNALGTTARFLYPYGLAMDSYGILYVADKDNKRIRQITASGNVTTFAGTGTNTNVDNANRLLATFVQPTGVVVNSSRTSLYVTQTVTPAVRKITLS